MIDNKKLSDIYDRHSRELFVYICGFVRVPETAEDILHDAFVRLMRYSEKYPLDDTNIRAFLYRISRNLCVDHARKSRSVSASPIDETVRSEEAGVPEELERQELVRTVQELVDRKDTLTRSVYLMRTELDMQYRDIAENLGISERTAKRKMSSMLEYLADSLEKSGFRILIFVLLALCALIFVL